MRLADALVDGVGHSGFGAVRDVGAVEQAGQSRRVPVKPGLAETGTDARGHPPSRVGDVRAVDDAGVARIVEVEELSALALVNGACFFALAVAISEQLMWQVSSEGTK